MALLVAGLAYWFFKGKKQSGPLGPPIVIQIQDVRPDKVDGQQAQLVLSGTPLPVELKSEVKGNTTSIMAMAFGEALETETYRVNDESIEFVGAIGETYEPPVLLLKTDLSQGENWEWTGKISSGAAYSAHANLTVTTSKLNLPGIDDNAIYVRMELYIEGVGPKPAKRELGFWFVSGKGLVKRDFGGASTRMPRTPENTASADSANAGEVEAP